MKQLKHGKIASFLLFVFVIILSFGLGTSLVTQAATSFPHGSQIGGLDVGGKTPEEVISFLTNEVEKWKNEGNMTLITKESYVEIPYSVIRFHIEESVEKLEQSVKKPWYAFFLKQEPQKIPLEVQVDRTWLEENFTTGIDIQLVARSIEETASYLGDHTVDLRNTTHQDVKVITEISWEAPADFHFLDQFIKQIDGLEIPANGTFSFLENVAERVTHYNAKEANFFASMLYTLALQSPLNIVERHSQREIPNYAEAGLEALVQKHKDKDLILANLSQVSYKFEANRDGNVVTLALKAMELPTTYEYKRENIEEVQFRTIIRYDKDLLPNHEQVIQEGKNGTRVEVYKIKKSPDGSVLAKEFVSRDFYLPTPKIVVKGVPEPEVNELENIADHSQEQIDDPGLSEQEYTDELEKVQDLANEKDDLSEDELQRVLALLMYLGYLNEEDIPEIRELFKNFSDTDDIDTEIEAKEEETIYENPHIEK